MRLGSMAAAGTYQVTSYTIYKKSGSVTSTLDSRSQLAGEMFSVEDNRQTDDALVPIQLSPTAAYIKDYIALKAIWEALDGRNWHYTGETSPAGATWNFNKEVDMWGDQPACRWTAKDALSACLSKASAPKAECPTPSAN